jgi:LPXTG-motif cell wall-anchored protein
MRTLLRSTAALAVAAVLVSLASAPALACSCAALPKPELGRIADVVFTGRARTVAARGNHVVARFVVEIPFKGSVPDEVDVSTATRGPACAYRFEQGALYTVFATRSGSGLSTNLCSGTTVGRIDPNEYGLVPRSTGSGSTFLTLMVGAALIGGALWALLRRRRDARWRQPPGPADPSR